MTEITITPKNLLYFTNRETGIVLPDFKLKYLNIKIEQSVSVTNQCRSVVTIRTFKCVRSEIGFIVLKSNLLSIVIIKPSKHLQFAISGNLKYKNTELCDINSENYLVLLNPEKSAHKVCFTGFRSKEMEHRIYIFGGIYSSSVTKDTTHLVMKDHTKITTEKAKKALSMRINIMSKQDYCETYLS